MCVWVGIWKYPFFYFCSISFVARVVPMKHNVITHTNSDCSVTMLPICASLGFGLVCSAIVFFISILKSYFSQCAITLLLQCLWRILADKSHNIYSQVRVIKSIASKCRHFKLKMETVFEKHSSWLYLLHLYLFSMNMLIISSIFWQPALFE